MVSVHQRIMKPTKAILFDLDGVLVPAVEWHYEAFVRALGDHGITITRELHDSVLNGLPTWKKLEILGVRADLIDLIEIAKAEYFNQIIEEKCRPNQEKCLLLKELHKKYLIAVCSNARSLSTYRMLERSNLLQYIDRVYGSDDVEYPKPNPEIYLQAMQRFHVTSDETVIVEDSVPGVAAAKASLARVMITPSYQDMNREFMKEFLR